MCCLSCMKFLLVCAFQVEVTVCAVVMVKCVAATVTVGLLLSLRNSTQEKTVAVILTTATMSCTLE